MADSELTAALALLARLQSAMASGDRAQQVEVTGGLIALRAPLGSQWRQLANLAANHGELGLARAALELFVEAAGGDANAQFQRAAALFDIGDLAAAEAVMRKLPEDVPDPTTHAYSRGVTALYRGRFDEARSHLERVVAARPQSGTTWLALASLSDLSLDPALAERVVGAGRHMTHVPAAEGAAYRYALGKLHADRGEHQSAFAAFASGAQLMRAVVSYDEERDRLHAADAVRDYRADAIAALGGRQRQPTARTIFVSGLPRSGTTLVQQILTSHSAVGGGGEFDRLSLLSREVGGPSCAALARFVSARGADSAARLWHHWVDERFGPAGRIVDKSLDTSRYLGLVAALLPEAPVIWLTRDALDCAWSCFRTTFRGGALPWSYDLKTIAAYFRLEERLLKQWQRLLGDRLLVVPYEALVTEPRPWIRRILAHCNLPEEPAVFAPHENGGAVTTASVAQIRRPIDREGIGSSTPYREYMQPFVDAYFD